MAGGAGKGAVRILIGAVVALAAVVAVVAVVLTDTTGRGGSGLGRSFDYDLEEFRKIDADLLKYQETGRMATGFEEVRAVAVGPQDRVFVAGDRTVAVFGPEGGRIQEIVLDGPARAVAVGEDGSLCVAIKHRVEIRAADGEPTASWEGPGEDPLFTSVALSRDDVFVADARAKVVLRYDLTGHLLNRIGEKDEAKGIPGLAVYQPYLDVAVGPEGLLRVTNPGRHRIEVYTFEGDLVTWWGEYSARVEGFCGCCNPVNIAILPSVGGYDGGTVTAEKYLPRVKVYDEGGELAAVVAGPEHFEGSPKRIDVAVDSRGRVLVLDPTMRAVRVFERKPGNRKQKSEFDVVLKSVGERKILVIKIVREVTGLGLADAKAIVDDLGTVRRGVPKEEAESIRSKLEAAGATVGVE